MKSFKVEPGERGLNVQCPNPLCKIKFIVPRKWSKGWTDADGRTYHTGSCPNCFKTFRRKP